MASKRKNDTSVRTMPVSIGTDGLEQVQEITRGRNADRLTFDHTVPQDKKIKFRLERNLPFVSFGRSELFSEHPCFDVDIEYADWQGTTFLIKFGYRKIAFLDTNPDFVFVKQRMRGYQTALQEAGFPVDPDLMKHISLEADIARDEARLPVRKGADAFVFGE